MYTNILMSTDGSEVAKKGVEHGIALAKSLKAKASVITVTEPLPVDYGSGHAAGWIPVSCRQTPPRGDRAPGSNWGARQSNKERG